MPDGYEFDEYAMDYVPTRVMLDCDRCELLRRVKELEAERDAARAWARLWKRAATCNRLDRADREGGWRAHRKWLYGCATLTGHWRWPWHRTVRRALGLPDATPDSQ